MHPLARFLTAGVVLAAGLFSASVWAAKLDLATATVADINAAFDKQALTSESLTRLYLARIQAYDRRGPMLGAVITLNPNALKEARALDIERKAKGPRSPLHGIPVLVKDNYNTYDMPTSAGCYVLKDSVPYADAFVVKKLREAGAIILAKTNMSEFAASGGSPDGYSSAGGQTRNPHDPTRSAGGSSSGTAAGLAAAYGQVGLGTDTLWSVRFPATLNGIVGLRPTTGLMSRSGIVPLALTHDTGGPMARSVYDVAVMLDLMAGPDTADEITLAPAARRETSYVRHLNGDALRGVRIGIPRTFFGMDAETDRVIAEALAKLKEHGAVIIDPVIIPEHVLMAKGSIHRSATPSEFPQQLDAYLATLRPGQPRSLAEIVERASAPGSGYHNAPKIESLRAQLHGPAPNDPLTLAAKIEGRAMIIATMKAVFAVNHLDALAWPTSPKPAHLIEDLKRVPGNAESGFNLAPVTGFPELTVPAGMTREGLPVGLSFFGLPYSEAQLLAYGNEFEGSLGKRALPRRTPALQGETISY